MPSSGDCAVHAISILQRPLSTSRYYRDTWLMTSCDDCVLVTCEIFPPGPRTPDKCMSGVSGLVHAQIYDLHILGPAPPSGWCDWTVIAQTVCSAGPAVLQSANQSAALLTADQSEAGTQCEAPVCRLRNNLAQGRQRLRELTI